MSTNSNLALVLDDDWDRHKAFKTYFECQGMVTIHVATVRSAIEALERHVSGEQRLIQVCLDHDLGEYGPSEYDPDKQREYTGRDVAQWMVANVDPASVSVRVHSWNIVAATGMERALREAGFAVDFRPFKMDNGEFLRNAKP